MFADGAGSFDVIAALPLADGYTVAFRNFDVQKQKAQMKQLRQGFMERTSSLRTQLRAKHQELRQASDGGTFNEALATQKLTEEAGLRAKMMGEEFKLHQDMLAVLTPEQKTQLDQLRQQLKTKRGEWRKPGVQ